MAYKKTYEKKEERDYQQELTDKFIARIEEAIASEEKGLKWDKPFLTCNEWPRNALTGEKYHGGNVATLMMEEFADPRWLTFNQMQELSKQMDKPLSIEKGSKASYIMKVVMAYEKDANGNVIKNEAGQPVPLTHEDGTPKIGFKWYPLFNASQVNGIEPYIKPNQEVKPFETVTMLQEALKEKTGLTIEHGSNGGAYYSSAKHLIHMPRMEQFKSSTAYADTFLHEAGHSTGPALGRKMGNGFGTEAYAYEELVAELSSSFMSVELGIPHNPSSHENHSAYLKSWLGALKNDKTLILKASNQASKSTEYQMNAYNEFKAEYDMKQSIQDVKTVEDVQRQKPKQVAMSM